MHDWLKDGSEGCDPDAGADEQSVLGMEDLAGGSPEGSVNIDVERGVHLLDVQLLPLHATRPEGIEAAVKSESSTIF